MEQTKVCPRCGQHVFADMDICYECLFEFAEYEQAVPLEEYDREPRANAAVWLRVSTSAADFSVPVPKAGIVVGRGSACDVVLHTPAVSRRHVQIAPDPEGLVVMDLGARNAACLNGHEIHGKVAMGAGDVLDVCGTSFALAPTPHAEREPDANAASHHIAFLDQSPPEEGKA